MKRTVLLLVTWMLACPSCMQTDFSGGGGTIEGGKRSSEIPAKDRNSEDAKANKRDPKTNGAPKDEPGTEQTETNPPLNTTTTPDLGQGGNNGGPGLLDIFGDLIKTLKEAEIAQPSDDEIVFGGGKVFHIGDDDFDSSTCRVRISTYRRTGKFYYFEFTVLEDQTTIETWIETVCGVDYADTNFVGMMRGNDKLSEQPVPPQSSSLTLPSQTLDRGTYQIFVESRQGAAENPQDFDDYLVGLLHIKGNKPIKAGQVGTRD